MITEARREKQRAYRAEWQAKNPDKQRDAVQRYRDANKEKRAVAGRQWREANADKLREMKHDWYLRNKDKVAGQVRRAQLKRYGLTEETYAQMFADQGSACAVCHRDTPGSTKGWHVDHCHTSGKTRGILCNHCNLMLGYAKDNQATLANAIEYLGKVS